MDISGLTGLFGSFFGSIIPFIFVLSIVVFVHEYGHYIVGRWCGVGVRAFSIGFGKELFGWTDRHGTRWKVSAIPLGGYVKFAGDVNAASTPDRAAMAGMTAAERAESFQHASLPRRAAIVAAGPLANFILAIVIFSLTIFVYGRVELIPRIDGVQENSVAAQAGFRAGDVVTAIDGHTVSSFADMQRIISGNAGEKLAFMVDRGGSSIRIEATPAVRELSTPFGKQRIGMLGIQGSRNPADAQVRHYGPVSSLTMGAQETWYVVDRTFSYLGRLIVGKESVDQLSGPIRIAQVSGHVAQMGLTPLLNLAAFLSVSIGLLNLFPVPMLDGGHLLFYAVEAVRGRPMSERIQEYGFRIGLALVLMLMLFVTWNDLMHLGTVFGLKAS